MLKTWLFLPPYTEEKVKALSQWFEYQGTRYPTTLTPVYPGGNIMWATVLAIWSTL